MINFPIILPELDPAIFSIGPISIRWYSLAYIIGIFFAVFWVEKINKKESFIPREALENLMIWIILSIILGGRVGYVLFYNLPYFLENPLEIFAFWNGGMSFHGGLLGSIFGMFLFTKKYQIDFLKFMDVVVITAPIGLFFGRIANFINMELYGRVTGSNFGVIFPNAGDLPRHPSQLYEAFLEGFLLFIILLFLSKFDKIRNNRGILSGLFLIFYGGFRILIENFREPDQQIGFLFAQVTMGQLLSLPLILFGTVLIFLPEKFKKFKKKLA